VIGAMKADINSSEYLHKIHHIEYSPAPNSDLEEEYNMQEVLMKIIKDKEVNSAHDISEGGLFIPLVESCFQLNKGFEINTNNNIRKDAFLFGEAQSRVVVTVRADKTTDFEAALGNQKFSKIGVVTGNENIIIDGENWGSIKNWKQMYDEAIEKLMA